MKKSILIAVILILIGGIILFFRSSEDSWIKNEKGVYVKHGNLSTTPDYVLSQQKLITKVLELYNEKKAGGMVFSSQCLGTIGDYAVDIVHVPRIEEDNNIENQCSDFREGKVKHFIELDKYGEIVRIA